MARGVETGVMSCNFPEIPVKFKSTDPVEYSKAVTYGRKMIHNMSQYLIKHLPGFEKAYISREAVMLVPRGLSMRTAKKFLKNFRPAAFMKFPTAP